MNKKAFFCLLCIYLFIYILNFLTPMSFGDDYVYAFIWPEQPMYVPLPETIDRVSSFSDLLISQWSHYFTGNGRAPAHLLVQFFIWQGKQFYNFLNAFISVLLILEICWISDRGIVSFKHLNAKMLLGVFFSLWAFTPGFNPVFLWICGACNYLWMAVFLLAFLIPYVRKFYATSERIEHRHLFTLKMFVLGLIAGWGNENSVCWIIALLILFSVVNRKSGEHEGWMYSGLAGLVFGYALLIFAPGNMTRLHVKFGSNWLNSQTINDNFHIFSIVLMFQLILWYFSAKSINALRKEQSSSLIVKKDIALAKILCFIAFGMSAMMLASPSFPLRSGFPGTIQLIIAANILLHIQRENNIIQINAIARKFLVSVGSLYFLMTSLITFQHSYSIYTQMENMISEAKRMQANSADTILTVERFKDSGPLPNLLSGLHLSYFDLSEDINDWGNVAFARYYGIKGVRMVNRQSEEVKSGAKKLSETTPGEYQSR